MNHWIEPFRAGNIVAELECGKPSAQIAHEHGLHPSLPSQWRNEWLTILKK
jgi:transposase-like protein